jgi:DinB superfamily
MIKDTIQQLNEAIDELLSSDLQAINWAYQSAPDKWSKKEIIGHLIDSALINLERFVRCTYEENFKLTYQQVEWVRAQHYREADVNKLLDLWQLLNEQIARVLQNYPPDRLKVQCYKIKTIESLFTVEWLAQDYVEHLEHHLKQILI